MTTLNSLPNLITKLSKRLQSKMKDYGVSGIYLNEWNELIVPADYDMDYSFFESIEAELVELGYEVEL